MQFLSFYSILTAGSKAYDSGIVCKCKMIAKSLLFHEEAEKAKREANRREETNQLTKS